MTPKSKSKTFPKGTEILINAIEDSVFIDPETKLLALSEIDRMKRGELSAATFEEFDASDNPKASTVLNCLFVWFYTENGHRFWSQLEELLKFSEL